MRYKVKISYTLRDTANITNLALIFGMCNGLVLYNTNGIPNHVK